MENEWIRIFPAPGTVIFDQIYRKVLKDDRFKYPCTELKVSIVDKEKSQKIKKQLSNVYKLILEWQNEDICGVDIYVRRN